MKFQAMDKALLYLLEDKGPMDLIHIMIYIDENNAYISRSLRRLVGMGYVSATRKANKITYANVQAEQRRESQNA